MSQPETPTPQGIPSPDWLSNLGQYRKQVVIGLVAAALLSGGVAAFMGYKFQLEYLSVAVWGGIIALICLVAAAYLHLAGPGQVFQWDEPAMAALDETRAVLLLVGGCAGFTTWVLSLALAVKWRDTILGGLEKWQGDDWWQLWVCLAALFGGLAIMLVSLLPARVVAHTNVTLRRLVYGYNAVLTGLLVLAILLVLNVLVYNYFTTSVDFSRSRMYTLSDKSKSILKSLKEPTRIYAMVSRNDYLTRREILTLLDNCRAVNDKIAVRNLSPQLDDDEMRDLMRRYQITEPAGMLVLYGSDPQIEHQFVKSEDIIGTDPDARGTGKAQFLFKGEDALMTALNSLLEGKVKTVIYFTQGYGELDINDAFASELDKGAGALREKLEKQNYEIKGLRFSPVAEDKGKQTGGTQVVVSTRVPEDATVVVVARPRQPLPGEVIDALRNYMEPKEAGAKKGKLFVLLDVVLDPGGNMVETGLEPFLASPFNVQVGKDRILRVFRSGGGLAVSQQLIATPDPNLASRNPVASAFEGQPFSFSEARTVRAAPGNPAGPSGYQAENLMLIPASQNIWAETNLRGSPVDLVNAYIKDRSLEQKLSRDHLPIAVVVNENMPPAPSADPHAAFRPGEQRPRLVVFGDASWACNRFINSPGGNFDLFSSTLAWLREKPASIGLAPKQRNIFDIKNLTDDNFHRMHFLPLGLILVGIVGLGTGVWIVRRR